MDESETAYNLDTRNQRICFVFVYILHSNAASTSKKSWQ